jgi:hypothetical protein
MNNPLNTEELLKLGNDLVKSIKNAGWLNKNRPNLTGPTDHMKAAIENFEEYTKPTCLTCGQQLPL